jgi:hypothetical protein
MLQYKGKNIQKYVTCVLVPETWSLILVEEREPRVLENKVLTKIFRCKEK